LPDNINKPVTRTDELLDKNKHEFESFKSW